MAKYPSYSGAEPYFTLVRQALGDRVDGEHFFDLITDETIYEVLYDLGWPATIRGQAALMQAFAGYVESVRVRAADHLVVTPADDGRVVVIEYQVHGTILASGARYDNRFCSIIELKDRKIAHWRDYMDSLAAFRAFSDAGG